VTKAFSYSGSEHPRTPLLGGWVNRALGKAIMLTSARRRRH
jgi:hypothetical protein